MDSGAGLCSIAAMTANGRDAQLLRRAPYLIVELDASLRICGWNEVAARILELVDADRGAPVATRVPANEPGFWDSLRDGVRRPATHPTCSVGWTGVVETDADGGFAGMVCWGRDITAEVVREARAKLESAMLRAIVENVDIVVWSMEPDGNCTYHEGKALAQAGLAPGAFVGKNIRAMYGGGGSDGLDRVFRGEVVHTISETHGVCFENWLIPMRGEAGGVEMLIAVSLDIGERVRGERALRDRLAQIEAQQRTIRALSTPIVEVWDRILTLPILGAVDAARAAELMDGLLQAVTRTRARFAILDLTGVQEIDAATAGHLLGLVRAIRLLGAEGVLTGVSPDIARAVVDLGLDLAGLVVRASLREALRHCLARPGRG